MKRFVLGLTLLAAIMSLLMLSTGSASAASLTLAWDSSPSTVAGYLVSWGTRSGVYDHTLDVGNALSTPVPGLADGTNYYFVVQAYSSNSTLSAYSNEVSGQTPTPAPRHCQSSAVPQPPPQRMGTRSRSRSARRLPVGRHLSRLAARQLQARCSRSALHRSRGVPLTRSRRPPRAAPWSS